MRIAYNWKSFKFYAALHCRILLLSFASYAMLYISQIASP